MKIVIMAGGTGGHIFPGIAVAKELIQQDVQVLWLGAIGGMEEKIVKQNGIPLKLLAIKGLRGKGIKGLITMPFKLLSATIAAKKYFQQEKVNAVLSMGGYVAGPGGLAAKLKGIPLVVHEQNSKFGMTNKYLAKWAKKVLTGFNLNGLYHSQWIGNPVRAEIETIKRTKKLTNTLVNVLVIGGSLGAQTLNNQLPELLKPLLAAKKIAVRHQSGKNKQKQTHVNYADMTNVLVHEFIEDMAEAYAWADIIIARAGALTIAEINAVGLPSILVPYPYAVDDHQTSNAQNIVANKAGFVWQESESKDKLRLAIEKLVDDAQLRTQMAQNSYKLHKPQAAKVAAQICLEVAV